MTIWFDMDGTLADLYGQKGWLADLEEEREKPYRNAKPLLNLQALARVLNRLQRQGYKIGIISWLSRGGSIEYGERVAQAKRKWLAEHLASVKWNAIHIVPYGLAKQNGRDGILFDDEERNRKAWNGIAYDETEIIKRLRALK